MNCTNFLCWNCRGVSNFRTVNRVKKLLNRLNLTFICLVETRADEDRTSRFCNKFSKRYDWAAIPARGFSGGIIILWRKGFGKITHVAFSRYALHLVITSGNPREWILSVVYNSQHIYTQHALWKSLSSIALLDLPWLIIGDFNAILLVSEHRGGNSSSYNAKWKLFNEFVSNNFLLDLGFLGPEFTWCNGRGGLARR